jgi:hypothetical protein
VVLFSLHYCIAKGRVNISRHFDFHIPINKNVNILFSAHVTFLDVFTDKKVQLIVYYMICFNGVLQNKVLLTFQ